jgi:hypothetical protein
MKILLAMLVLITPAAAALAQTGTPGQAPVSEEPQPPAQQPAATPEQAAATAWLELVDSGRYQESWDAAARLFRGQMPAEDWSRLVAGVREPIGALQSRRLQSSTAAASLPGAPDGEYMMLQFISSFANKAHAQERVTLMREGDVWRVAGYYIR